MVEKRFNPDNRSMPEYASLIVGRIVCGIINYGPAAIGSLSRSILEAESTPKETVKLIDPAAETQIKMGKIGIGVGVVALLSGISWKLGFNPID